METRHLLGRLYKLGRFAGAPPAQRPAGVAKVVHGQDCFPTGDMLGYRWHIAISRSFYGGCDRSGGTEGTS